MNSTLDSVDDSSKQHDELCYTIISIDVKTGTNIKDITYQTLSFCPLILSAGVKVVLAVAMLRFCFRPRKQNNNFSHQHVSSTYEKRGRSASDWKFQTTTSHEWPEPNTWHDQKCLTWGVQMRANRNTEDRRRTGRDRDFRINKWLVSWCFPDEAAWLIAPFDGERLCFLMPLIFLQPWLKSN